MKKIIMGLVVGILIGIGGYFLYDNFIISDVKKEEKPIKENSSKKELMDTYSEDIQKLYKKIQFSATCYPAEINEENMNINFFKENAINIALTNLEKFSMQNNGSGFTYNDLNNAAKKVFGKNFTLENKIYDIPLYKYDDDSKSYVFDETKSFGCTGNTYVDKILYKAIRKNNKIELYESILYVMGESGVNKYFSDSNFSKEINECNNRTSLECYKKIPKYKFIFEKESDNYNLINIEKVTE